MKELSKEVGFELKNLHRGLLVGTTEIVDCDDLEMDSIDEIFETQNAFRECLSHRSFCLKLMLFTAVSGLMT